MDYKDILVHLDSSPSCPARIDVAIAFARAFGAKLTGLYVVGLAPMHQYAEADLGPELVEAHDRYMREAAHEAERIFTEHTRNAGVAAEWRQVEGPLPDLVMLHARFADLVIAGQRNPERLDPGTAPELPEQMVLDVGRPVIIVPHTGAFQTVGERVLILWKTSRGAARAVNDALPFLRKAKEVCVLTINPESGISGQGDNPAADVVAHLSRHGIAAQGRTAKTERGTMGQTMRDISADFGADMIVMGAFGRARWREMILGGMTRNMLAKMEVPILMSR
ncbi:MAG TPA: universal stress protein [Alphaproteobacteria bacterium]|jgi:nucleotide-binding universal stress UspA family protein